MASALHIQGIRKTFGKADKTVEVLKKIDIDVAPGEFLILVGPSGCGKSTLLNIIAGLEDPTEGAIRIGDRNVVGVPPAQRDIAMVFQNYALYPTMSVAGREHRFCAGNAQSAQGRARQTHWRGGGHAANRAFA